MVDAMDAEFNDLAWWTCGAVEELGHDHAIAAACRGSGGPLALAWLAESCDLRPGMTLLDVGAGVGGPAAWVVKRYGVRVVLVDPMESASRASARLFGLPAVSADGLAVPLRSASVDAAWCLGVLCTVEDKLGVLAEIRRVLRPGRGLGLLVLVARPTESGGVQHSVPEGNDFPSQNELLALLDRSGFDIVEQIEAPRHVPVGWTRRSDRVDVLIDARHRHDERYRQAEEQSHKLSKLLHSGQVSTQLVHAVSRATGECAIQPTMR